MGNSDGQQPTLGQRLLWFVGLWAAGVVIVTTLGYVIRLVVVGG